MKLFKVLLAALALSIGGASAQQLINCATNVPCGPTGPKNTGTGDAPWLGGSKINANITALYNGAGNFIPGTFTNAQVLANFPPSVASGKTVYSTDQGLMTSDGVRWLSMTPPPIPPGAAILGYTHNVYTIFPTVADITMTRTAGSISRLYNGIWTSGTIPPASVYTTAPNGQLQLIFPQGGPANAAGLLTTISSIPSQSLQSSLGYLPYLLGSNGFCAEIAETMSGNDTDIFDAFYLEPQEHNTLQADHKPGDPPTYERWMEFDVNESGHGTDLGGAFRGAFLYWVGPFSGALTFSAPPSGTGGTLLAAASNLTDASGHWLGDTLSIWNIKFSDNQTHIATLTNGSATVTWTGAITGTPSVNATVGYVRPLFPSNIVTTSLDYTTEHIFTLCYDPLGNTVTWWQDDVMQNTVSTAGADAYTKTLHYVPIIQMASRGGFTGSTVNVRYLSAWTP